MSVSPREELTALAVGNGGEAEMVASMVASMSDEHVAEMIETIKSVNADRDAFRARLAANPTLMQAVCPEPTWKDAQARYDVAKKAVRIIEAVAAKHNLTVDAIAETLVAEHGTIIETIAMHGERGGDRQYDPRTDAFAPGQSFYAFRWRLKDAVDTLTADAQRAEQARKDAEQDAKWDARGLKRCERCFGRGGRADWPGFTCFDCDGHGAVPKDFHHKH